MSIISIRFLKTGQADIKNGGVKHNIIIQNLINTFSQHMHSSD